MAKILVFVLKTCKRIDKHPGPFHMEVTPLSGEGPLYLFKKSQ